MLRGYGSCNTLHFYKQQYSIHLFYHSIIYCNEALVFSAHLVGRYIARCHFVAMCTCSGAHTLELDYRATPIPAILCHSVISIDEYCTLALTKSNRQYSTV